MKWKRRVGRPDTVAGAGAAADEVVRRLDARLVAAIAAAGNLSFCAVVFETALNVALPALMEEFGVGTATIQWITSGYLLTLAIMIPLFPYLKRRFPLRRLFLAAVALFLAGTLACGLAPAFAVLLAGRVVQGLGTGVAIPLMFSLVVDQVPYDRMGLMMGFASLITSLAPAVGPTYGGIVIGLAGWRWVFLALVPLVAGALAVGAVCIRQVTGLDRGRFDMAGFLLVDGGFFALVFGVNQSSETGWLSASVQGLLALAVVLIAAFAVHALRTPEPLIDVRMFSCGAFSCSVGVVALIAFAILAYAYLVPNFAQLALGADEIVAGTLLLPGCLGAVVFAPVGGRLLDAHGARVPIAVGMVLLVAATALYAACAAQLTPALLMGCYVLFGTGQGLAFSATMTNGLAQLPEAQRTGGNSVFNTLQQLGGSIGVSAVTAVVGAAQADASAGAASLAEATAAGGASAFAVLAGVMVVAAALSVESLMLARHS